MSQDCHIPLKALYADFENRLVSDPLIEKGEEWQGHARSLY
jgi:hypothetical protein